MRPRWNTLRYQTHTHELWVTGKGFTRGAYGTKIDFDPPLKFGNDQCRNRSCIVERDRPQARTT